MPRSMPMTLPIESPFVRAAPRGRAGGATATPTIAGRRSRSWSLKPRACSRTTVPGGCVRGRDLQERLVQRRVEGSPIALKRRDAVPRERLLERGAHEPDAVRERIARGRGGERAIEPVERPGGGPSAPSRSRSAGPRRAPSPRASGSSRGRPRRAVALVLVLELSSISRAFACESSSCALSLSTSRSTGLGAAARPRRRHLDARTAASADRRGRSARPSGARPRPRRRGCRPGRRLFRGVGHGWDRVRRRRARRAERAAVASWHTGSRTSQAREPGRRRVRATRRRYPSDSAASARESCRAVRSTSGITRA